MNKTPEQVLAEGAANKTRATTGTNDVTMRVSVGSDNNAVIKHIPDMFQDVVDFHKKFGIQYDGPPRGRDGDLFKFRDLRFHEEIREIRDAIDACQAAEELDGYVDLIYIILGTCHLRGWDFNTAWKRVHEANMKKERANKDNPGKYGTLGDKVDIVKPPGWTAPDMTDLVIVKKEESK
mgnify:CR=1 FL=1